MDLEKNKIRLKICRPNSTLGNMKLSITVLEKTLWDPDA